jgi:hypothetical protein
LIQPTNLSSLREIGGALQRDANAVEGPRSAGSGNDSARNFCQNREELSQKPLTDF